MFESNAQFVALFLLVMILGIAVVTDLRQNRIPNVLTAAGVTVALTLQCLSDGLSGLYAGCAGMGVALMFFLPFYLMRGLGAGDVKLMLVVGAFLGPLSALLASAATMVAGALLGLGLTLRRGVMRPLMRRYWTMIRVFAYTRRPFYQPPTDEDVVVSQPFPYAAAMAVGTLIAVLASPELARLPAVLLP